MSLGCLLTALVLAYELSISKPASDLHTSENEKPSLLVQMEGGPPAVADSVEDAVAARGLIPHDLPPFAKPLFYTLLTGTFVSHIPGIVLSTLLAYKSPVLDSTLHPALNNATKIILSFPGQTLAILLNPFLVGVACLVRTDGAALWRYRATLAEPFVPAQAQNVKATESLTKAESQVQT